METIYYYVDESFRQHDGYWHCNIGGMLVPSADTVETEIELNAVLHQLAASARMAHPVKEFKFSDLFREEPDDFKFKVCARLAEVLAQRKVRFLVSHAKAPAAKLERLSESGFFRNSSLAIQQLAHVNISNYLAENTSENVVQMIVQLGLSGSFRSTYDMYSWALSSIPEFKVLGIQDEAITVANFRHLPPPLFMDSKHSRILQFSDLLIGLLLCRELGELTDFKRALLDRMAPVIPDVTHRSVEWNIDGA